MIYDENLMDYELKDNDMSSDEGRLFKKEPKINVISKKDFEDRVDRVFHLLWKTLSKSFGPYGAPTLIYNYPWSHATKDGYTIMKNLSFDASETKVDQSIADMASDICGRLNYSVGDGTTSAIIATNGIYERYRDMRKSLNMKNTPPRVITQKYEEIKNKVYKNIMKKVVPIHSSDMNELKENIAKVVYISSNGDEQTTEYISDLYKELGTPAITCKLAQDGVSKKILVNGYQYELSLADKLYINNDENTMELQNADVIIFGAKVTNETYLKIIKPLNEECRQRGRHLIVAAPLYDEKTLANYISPDLNKEYNKTHDINLVITVYRAISAHTRKLINDFAVLMNTQIIDKGLENKIITELDAGNHIWSVFNIDERDIPNINRVCVNEEQKKMFLYANTEEDKKEIYDLGSKPINDVYPLVDQYINLGYIKKCSLGLKISQFLDMIYDQKRYETILKEAETELKEAEEKYQKLGTFNTVVNDCMNRLYALRLKMGIIEVGADSELSQKLIKDSVDDAVKAAQSAYDHGIILGCNVNLIQSIKEVIDTEDDELTKILSQILLEGFKDVYRTVLNNSFEDVDIELVETVGKGLFKRKYAICNETAVFTAFKKVGKTMNATKIDSQKASEIIAKMINNNIDLTLHNFIIEYSIDRSVVYDVSKDEFTTDVINSSQTDCEILKATVDLIALIIVGNQMVVTQKHNF